MSPPPIASVADPLPFAEPVADTPPTAHPANSPITHGRKWLVVLLLAVGGAGAAFALNKKKSEQPSPASPVAPPTPQDAPAVVVTVEPVTARPIARVTAVVGTLQGSDQLTVTANVEGHVAAYLRDVGDIVKPGEVLLEIDPTEFDLAVLKARRGLDRELARLGLDRIPGQDFDPSGIKTVVRAVAAEQRARSKYDTIVGGAGGTSKDERVSAQKDWEVAAADARIAVLEARAAVDNLRILDADLALALKHLKDTRVVAPSPKVRRDAPDEYVIASRDVSEGEFVRSGPQATALFKLVADKTLKLLATLSERDRVGVKPGQPVEVRVEYRPGEAFAGTVEKVYPTVDKASRTFTVEIRVPNADRKLSCGSYAKARITTAEDPAVPTVPEEAVVSFAGVTKVFEVVGDRVRAVPVKLGAFVEVGTGERRRVWLEATGDLKPGTPVVTSGQSRLGDGSVVRVREPATGKGAGR